MPDVDIRSVETVFERASETLVYSDRPSGLRGVLVIETTRGTTAVGGTRFMAYPSISAALVEMAEFAVAVTYKSVLAGLPCGGAKGAILGDPAKLKSEALLRAFGRVVQQLGGRYTVTPDWGMNPADLKIVASECDYVTGISGGTEPLVAAGVVEGIKAAAGVRNGSPSLAGLRIGIEGLAMSGPHLVELLLEENAHVIAAEPSAALRAAIGKEHPRVDLLDSVATLQKTELDVYCPCAGSGTLTKEYAAAGPVKIVCGAANGQLASPDVEQVFSARGVTYVPEFAANGGGVVYCYEERIGYDEVRANKAIASIGPTVTDILNRAAREKRPATDVAVEIAREKLSA